MKQVIRRRVHPRLWSAMAVAYHQLVRLLAETVAGIVAAILWFFPDAVALRLRERLTLRRTLDCEWARIVLQVTSTIEQQNRLRSCEKEPETVTWLRQTLQPGDVMYDIGANVGAYSLIGAYSSTKKAIVYAFEPGYRTFSSLVENISLNGAEGCVIPLQVALGERTALAEFRYSTKVAGGASHPGFSEDVAAADSWTQMVPCYRLDDLVSLFGLDPPTHMKIDVDGGELAVLRGASRVLRNPLLCWILVEVREEAGIMTAVRQILEVAGFALVSDCQHADGQTHNWIFQRAISEGARPAPNSLLKPIFQGVVRG